MRGDALIKYIDEHEEDIKKKSKEEKKTNIKKWVTFFRRNLDIFNRDFLEIDLAVFQDQMINCFTDNDVSTVICSRGISKSFDVGLTAIDFAELYPNIKIGIISLTLQQSNSIITEKIEKIFCARGTRWSSPILVQQKDDGYITFGQDQNTGGKIVKFGNGSEIQAFALGESLRGRRTNIIIVDEFCLVKKKDVDEIALPTLEVRKFKGRPIDYPEETKQMFLSSARNKANWGWKHLVKCVNGHYKKGGTKYGFFCGDIFTAVGNGIQTIKQYYQRKRDTDELSFMQEYLNCWLGGSDTSIFKYEDFEKCQVLNKAFYPQTLEEFLDEKKSDYTFNENEIRILGMDIAVATGDSNDNTVFSFVTLNLLTGKRRTEAIMTLNGVSAIEQVALAKRYFYDYHATYFCYDNRGIGRIFANLITQETQDSMFGKTYPAWTSAFNTYELSSDTVIADSLQTQDKNAEHVVIPYTGTAELNSMMYLSLRQNIKNENILFLKDDTEFKLKMEDSDPMFMLKSSEEKARILMPYVQTTQTINEALALETKFTETNLLKVSEPRSGTKDRVVCVAMCNLLCDRIYTQYQTENNGDIDFEDENLQLVF